MSVYPGLRLKRRPCASFIAATTSFCWPRDSTSAALSPRIRTRISGGQAALGETAHPVLLDLLLEARVQESAPSPDPANHLDSSHRGSAIGAMSAGKQDERLQSSRRAIHRAESHTHRQLAIPRFQLITVDALMPATRALRVAQAAMDIRPAGGGNHVPRGTPPSPGTGAAPSAPPPTARRYQELMSCQRQAPRRVLLRNCGSPAPVSARRNYRPGLQTRRWPREPAPISRRAVRGGGRCAGGHRGR